MTDLLREFVLDNALNKKSVLNLIDDYSLYCHYIGQELELGRMYSSPLREGDDTPSFGMVLRGDTIIFRDFTTDVKGDVFKFIGELLGLSLEDVLIQIDSDLELGIGSQKVGPRKPRITKSFKQAPSMEGLEVTSRKTTHEWDNFWGQFGIGEKILEEYEVTQVSITHYIFAAGTKRVFSKDLTIAYCMFGFYKIYRPYASKRDKFRTNFAKNFVEGAIQLNDDKSLLIITKSTKECMFFRQHFGINAIAGISETTSVNAGFMKKVMRQYHRVIVWLDNDETGRDMQARYKLMYPMLEEIMLPDELMEKDPTDLYKFAADKEGIIHYINKLIYGQ